MSRRLEPNDVVAIQKLRMTLREESSHSSNTQEEQSTIDDPTLDPFHQDLLLKDKVTDIRITGHQLVAPSEKAREFASYQIEVATLDLCYRLNRRFSQFHLLYRQVRKSVSLKCEFPRKVYNPFVSSTSPAVVEERSAKLHFFLKEVLNHVRASRDATITTLLFSFLGLKDHYEQKQLTPNYKKCNSEKLAYYRMLSIKPTLSDGLRTTHDQNSLEFKLILLTHNCNSDKVLHDIDELIKAKRAKLTLDQIKTLMVGDGECPGLLRYGLSNPSENNRVTALEMLLGLLLPQRNPHAQKFQKALERLLTEEWRVHEISLFDSSLFKALYFRLLSLYCERIEREYNRSETTILKDLFLFHQDLYNNYYLWKKMHQRENGLKENLKMEATIDYARRIELTDFEQDKQLFEQIYSSQNLLRSAYISRANSLLVFYLQSAKEIKEDELLGWNRFTCDHSVDQYTSIVRASLNLGKKKIGLRARSFKQNEIFVVLGSHKRILSQISEINQASDLLQSCDSLILKEQYPVDFESEFLEMIWLKKEQDRSRILITIHFECGLAGTNIEIDQLGKELIEDINSKFPL